MLMHIHVHLTVTIGKQKFEHDFHIINMLKSSSSYYMPNTVAVGKKVNTCINP